MRTPDAPRRTRIETLCSMEACQARLQTSLALRWRRLRSACFVTVLTPPDPRSRHFSPEMAPPVNGVGVFPTRCVCVVTVRGGLGVTRGRGSCHSSLENSRSAETLGRSLRSPSASDAAHGTIGGPTEVTVSCQVVLSTEKLSLAYPIQSHSRILLVV